MPEFRITFGHQYARRPHPLVELTEIGRIIRPEGWVTVIAPCEQAARDTAFALFGRNFSFVYSMEEVANSVTGWDRLFPAGELFRWEMTHWPKGYYEEESDGST